MSRIVFDKNISLKKKTKFFTTQISDIYIFMKSKHHKQEMAPPRY